MSNLDERPLVTFALFAYNQEKFITEAVHAALNQKYTPLQIIFSDDSSTDGTYELICEIVSKYDGCHEVILNKNKMNLGIGAHVNRVMEMARGDFIVVAAGDDVSKPNRVQNIVDVFLNSGEKIYSVWSRAHYIDADGNMVLREFPGGLVDFDDKTMVRNVNPVIGATHAWRREVFDFFGPLMDGVVFEDNAISFRSYLLGVIKYLDDDLVGYRTHDRNITNFVEISDFFKLYSSATKRSTWALIGVEQRKKDLKYAFNNMPMFYRNFNYLNIELLKIERKFRRRLRNYQQFPKLSIHMLMDAFRDIEIGKVVIRAIKYRLTSLVKCK